MRNLKHLCLIVFSLMLASCGNNSGEYGKTTVTINLGQKAGIAGAASAPARAIPASVSYIRFHISAPDISPIEQISDITAIETVEEIFDVPNGPDRHFEVFAYDNSGALLYYGDTYADLAGTPVDITIMMVNADVTAPVFDGAATATTVSSTEIDLSWTAATDDVTPQQNIVYLIYISTTSGGQDFQIPQSFTTSPGATTYSVTGLTSSTTYYFVVRAKDEAGNVDNNSMELSATTLDAIPPAFGGVAIAAPVSSTQIDLSWTAATDDVTPQQNIVYLIYISTTSGGQNFQIPPSFTTSPGATAFSITGLVSSTTYYFVVKAKDEAGNVDLNTFEAPATTVTPPDTTPPAFGGVGSTAAFSSSIIDLSWTAATDLVTPQLNIVYLIYVSTTSGGQDLQTPSFTTSPGATAFSVTGLASSTTYYFVVRAKDEAGNVDSNTAEQFAATLDGTPPAFGGVETATAISSTQIDLSWTAATDDVTLQSDIVYLIYVSIASGGQDFLTPSFTTSPGATAFSVTGLASSTTYYFVVRAMDEAGQIDSNSVELPATTLDSIPPTFGGVETAIAAISSAQTAAIDNVTPQLGSGIGLSAINLSWTAATDNVTPQQNIVYLIYISTTSGGQDFLVPPTFTTVPGATTYSVTGLASLTTYYFVVRAKDEAGNIDGNTVEKSATTTSSM